MKNPAVYILTNKNKTVLYTGVTSNLEKRMWEHKNKITKGFTKQFNIDILVYYENHLTMEDAIHREKMIKKRSRRGKENLINAINPSWADLQTLV